MANHKEPNENQIRELILASRMLSGVQKAARAMGVTPTSWVAALVDEIAFIAHTEREPGVSLDFVIETTAAMFTDAIREYDEDDIEKRKVSRLNIGVLLRPLATDGMLRLGQTIGDLEAQVNAAIAKGAAKGGG